jgi:hypothetical protein
MIVEIIHRNCHFLAHINLEAQVIVIDTMIAAFRRLGNRRNILLPEVHKTWPHIVQRLKGILHIELFL